MLPVLYAEAHAVRDPLHAPVRGRRALVDAARARRGAGGARGMTLRAPSSLGRFWLWASVGVLAAFGTFAPSGAIVWPLVGVAIGLLAARTVTRNRALLAVAAGLAGLALAAATHSAWPLVAGLVAALALPLLHTRRDAAVLVGGLALGAVVVFGLHEANDIVAIALAPALVIL